MNVESASIGHELAWEARRLADESPYALEQRAILDFGDSACVGYRTKPWGFISVEFNSEYFSMHGKLIHGLDQNPCVASIMVESRYRSVRAIGDLLCDREWHEIYADGNIESSITKGELSAAIESGDSDEIEAHDVTAQVFNCEGFTLKKTLLQEQNSNYLNRLGSLLDVLSEGDQRRSKVIEEIEALDFSGEEEMGLKFTASPDQLRELLAQLKLLEPTDKLGTFILISTVDHFLDSENSET